MFYSLAQIIIIARGNDEGWMNILVLVVLAAVYGLGALIKAKGKKAEDQAQEPQARKPQRKPSAGGRGILEQLFREIQHAAEGKPSRVNHATSQTTPQQIARPQTAIRKYASQAKQANRVQPITAPAKPKLSKPTPQVQTDFEQLSGFDTGIQSLPEFKSKDMPAKAVESGYLSEVLSDYEDPEDLKRAILHYEILGKPLSLRDPSRVFIGL
ncbi:MAG: hypothetical protein H8D56_12130 [Planctomycetes bacterium]|nr:hypothetical protein [Planctomycetota bacterium]MBL7144257.1 hypothetical protein [Phycisphaerae bacterium]